MTYSITIKKEAYLDALDAYLYYEEQQSGLGERFLNELASRYKQLERHPQHYSIVASDKEGTFRSVRLKSFPYLIIFSISEDLVTVYAVHNTYKKPKLF